MYWAEGGKKVSCFQFINSDPEMLRMMIRWIEKYFNYPKECLKYRLFMHELYANENCENYWAQGCRCTKGFVSKTIYKPTAHTVKKKFRIQGVFTSKFWRRNRATDRISLAKAINRVLGRLFTAPVVKWISRDASDVVLQVRVYRVHTYQKNLDCSRLFDMCAKFV